ncbi:hypothetical protein [Alteraurantiacibacter buctensis]|nr:hypothetical protein [Alteraurantiacibacter buctensis]
MRLLGWTAPGGSTELVVAHGPADAAQRLLVLPAWFDEANKTRHFTQAVMRHLADAGVASVLPDLPGCNESLAPFESQSMATWRAAAQSSAEQLGATHVLAMRAAVAIAPSLPGWAYAPVAGKSVLRGLLRARVLSAREAGRQETSEALLASGLANGLDLAGYRLGAQMVADLADGELAPSTFTIIAQNEIGGAGLWLRAEPDHDAAQAETLAALVAGRLST